MAHMVKKPPANAGDVRNTGSIPGSGRSPGEGHGIPLQYSWASLVGQNPLAMRETWIQNIGKFEPEFEQGLWSLVPPF